VILSILLNREIGHAVMGGETPGAQLLEATAFSVLGTRTAHDHPWFVLIIGICGFLAIWPPIRHAKIAAGSGPNCSNY